MQLCQVAYAAIVYILSYGSISNILSSKLSLSFNLGCLVSSSLLLSHKFQKTHSSFSFYLMHYWRDAPAQHTLSISIWTSPINWPAFSDLVRSPCCVPRPGAKFIDLARRILIRFLVYPFFVFYVFLWSAQPASVMSQETNKVTLWTHSFHWVRFFDRRAMTARTIWQGYIWQFIQCFTSKV